MSAGIETSIHHVEATVHGRYLLRLPSARPAGLLVGFHGYGEDAGAHLAALLEVPGAGEWALAAVQALHPFYRSSTGDVVASWMTRLDRDLAIADNVRYVGTAVADARRRAAVERPLVYLGFSQGVAMAYRAAAGAGHACDALCVLAGDLPPELAERELPGFPPVLLGAGKDDSRFNPSVLERDAALLEGKGVRVATCLFDGGHEWSDAYRRAVAELLRGLRAEPAG
jgi:predicted esterase